MRVAKDVAVLGTITVAPSTCLHNPACTKQFARLAGTEIRQVLVTQVVPGQALALAHDFLDETFMHAILM